MSKIVARIQKLFRLAEGTPSKEEASAALLLARQLMAEHAIDEADIEDAVAKAEAEDFYEQGRFNALRLELLTTIALAHRCQIICVRKCNEATGWRGVSVAQVVGFPGDRAIVRALFDWSWRVVCAGADEAARRERVPGKRTNTTAVRQGYHLGFCYGLSEAYEKQTKANPAWALVLATPTEVTGLVEEITKGRSHRSSKTQEIDGRAVRAGFEAGEEHGRTSLHNPPAELTAMPKRLATNAGDTK